MRIVVCVKHVPDAAAGRRFAADMTTERTGVDGLLSELDEYAVEEALRLSEQRAGTEVVVLTVGPPQAADALRRALQMGADGGVHVCDDALHGSDAVATSLVLAAAVRQVGEVDLVVTGMASTDGGMGVVPAMLAERLDLPQVTLVSELTVEGDGPAALVHGRRDGDDASLVLQSSLPAVVSVTDQTNEPRYPTFKGIMGAKKKPVRTLALADLGVDPDEVGLAASRTVVRAITPRPPRAAGQVIEDAGDGGLRLAEFLVAAKVL